MKIKNVDVSALNTALTYGSYWKDKSLKDKPLEDKIKAVLALTSNQRIWLLRSINVHFDMECSMYFIKKLSSYEIQGLIDSYDVLIKMKRFKMINNNKYVLDYMFNFWKDLVNGLNKFKNKKEKLYSILLNKEVTYSELLNYVIMNMPSGINFDIVFSISYYDLKNFIENENKNELVESIQFIEEIKKLTLFNELAYGVK